MNILSPSILSADFWKLGEDIQAVEKAGVSWLHIDVMDGLFVPSISYGMPVLKCVRKGTGLFLDVHLMIEKPERYIKDFANSGADLINFHVEATEQVDISRSSFYKYKDDIFPFHDNTRGRTLTFMLQLDDKPGLLSNVLGVLANAKANVLTIHQAIPTGGIASITLSVEIQPETEDTESMMRHLEAVEGIHYLKILGFE